MASPSAPSATKWCPEVGTESVIEEMGSPATLREQEIDPTVTEVDFEEWWEEERAMDKVSQLLKRSEGTGRVAQPQPLPPSEEEDEMTNLHSDSDSEEINVEIDPTEVDFEEFQVPLVHEGTPPSEMDDLSERKCPEPNCEATFPTRRCLSWHLTSSHVPFLHTCPHCERSFPLYPDLRWHLASDHDLFQCFSCGKFFSGKKRLLLHRAHEHKDLKDPGEGSAELAAKCIKTDESLMIVSLLDLELDLAEEPDWISANEDDDEAEVNDPNDPLSDGSGSGSTTPPKEKTVHVQPNLEIYRISKWKYRCPICLSEKRRRSTLARHLKACHANADLTGRSGTDYGGKKKRGTDAEAESEGSGGNDADTETESVTASDSDNDKESGSEGDNADAATATLGPALKRRRVGEGLSSADDGAPPTKQTDFEVGQLVEEEVIDTEPLDKDKDGTAENLSNPVDLPSTSGMTKSRGIEDKLTACGDSDSDSDSEDEGEEPPELTACAERDRHCALCLTLVPKEEVRVCSGCKRRAYCSKECQKEDWKTPSEFRACRAKVIGVGQGHKNWCGLPYGEEDLDWEILPWTQEDWDGGLVGKLRMVALRDLPPFYRILVGGKQRILDEKKGAFDSKSGAEWIDNIRLVHSRTRSAKGKGRTGNAAFFTTPTFTKSGCYAPYNVRVLFSEKAIKEGEEILRIGFHEYKTRNEQARRLYSERAGQKPLHAMARYWDPPSLEEREAVIHILSSELETPPSIMERAFDEAFTATWAKGTDATSKKENYEKAKTFLEKRIEFLAQIVHPLDRNLIKLRNKLVKVEKKCQKYESNNLG